eukprot:SAG11_NODE_127_length_15677_cov_10.890872_5_plen_65_part_00
MCTLVHLRKYSFVFVEKYTKFSISNCGYEKECFNCNVYFESNEATILQLGQGLRFHRKLRCFTT